MTDKQESAVAQMTVSVVLVIRRLGLYSSNWCLGLEARLNVIAQYITRKGEWH